LVRQFNNYRHFIKLNEMSPWLHAITGLVVNTCVSMAKEVQKINQKSCTYTDINKMPIASSSNCFRILKHDAYSLTLNCTLGISWCLTMHFKVYTWLTLWPKLAAWIVLYGDMSDV